MLIQIPPDGGSLYAETNLSRFFPEPLNALTSFFFLGIALFWTIKLKGRYKSHLFLSVALGLLYIGGIGGTLYHGLRQWSFFIIMDWLPILLLCISAGVYFLSKLINRKYALLLALVYMIVQFLFRNTMKVNPHLFININYALMALIVLLPVAGYLSRTNWLHGKWVGLALIAFMIALTFRIADKWQLFDFGTHFLWHIFGAVASFCMFNFIYLVNARKDESLPQ
jgi:hypothetical protein